MPNRKRNFDPKKRVPDKPIMDLGAKEHKPPEFVVRLLTCVSCKAREAGRWYEFVNPGIWKCVVCCRKERDQCDANTEQQSD
jgi:hypothetical protein